MKKYNDNSSDCSEWTTKKLKSEAKDYYSRIYGEGVSYGSSDIQMYDRITSELSDRGIEIKLGIEF